MEKEDFRGARRRKEMEGKKVIYCISIKNVYSVTKNLENEALVIGKRQKNRTHRVT